MKEGGPSAKQALLDYERVYFPNTVRGRRIKQQLEDYCTATGKRKSAAIRDLLEESLESKRVFVQQRLTEYQAEHRLTPEQEKRLEAAMRGGWPK